MSGSKCPGGTCRGGGGLFCHRILDLSTVDLLIKERTVSK